MRYYGLAASNASSRACHAAVAVHCLRSRLQCRAWPRARTLQRIQRVAFVRTSHSLCVPALMAQLRFGAFRHSRTNHRHGKTIRRQDERLLAALSVPNETGRMAVADYKLPLVNKKTVTTLESEQSSNPAF